MIDFKESPSNSHHIWIVSENRLFAEAIGHFLCSTEQTDHCYHVNQKGFADLLYAAEVEPEVALLDAESFRDLANIEGFIQFAQTSLPDTKIVLLSESVDWPFLPRCVELGIDGVTLKSESFEQLLNVIAAARRGQAHCCGAVVEAVLKRIRLLAQTKHDNAPDDIVELTKREIEILHLVERGFINKKIASQLGLAMSTVKNHLHNIFEKLNVNSRQAAVRQAIAAGILHCQSDCAVA